MHMSPNMPTPRRYTPDMIASLKKQHPGVNNLKHWAEPGQWGSQHPQSETDSDVLIRVCQTCSWHTAGAWFHTCMHSYVYILYIYMVWWEEALVGSASQVACGVSYIYLIYIYIYTEHKPPCLSIHCLAHRWRLLPPGCCFIYGSNHVRSISPCVNVDMLGDICISFVYLCISIFRKMSHLVLRVCSFTYCIPTW